MKFQKSTVNNNNNHDDIYSAVIMAEPLRELYLRWTWSHKMWSYSRKIGCWRKIEISATKL